MHLHTVVYPPLPKHSIITKGKSVLIKQLLPIFSFYHVTGNHQSILSPYIYVLAISYKGEIK